MWIGYVRASRHDVLYALPKRWAAQWQKDVFRRHHMDDVATAVRESAREGDEHMQSRSAWPKFSSFSFGGGGRGGGTFFRLLKRKISPGPSLCCRAFPPLLKIPSRVNWRDNHDDMERNKQLRRRHSIYLLVQLIKGLELLLRLRLNACNSSCQCALYSKRKKKTGPK